MKKISILFLLFTATVFAQKSVKGKVVDNNNEPLPYVTIILKNPKEQKTAVTDFNGVFSIENIKGQRYNITIEYIGFKTVNRPIAFQNNNNIDLKTIRLEEDAEKLDAVVVRAATSTVTQKIDRFVVSVGKDLTSAGTDAASVLNNVQSVSVDQQSGELSLRGNNNVRVLIDGKPSNIPTDQLLKQIPSNAIKNIEVITTPSAKYNPEGNSGIINIELVKNSLQGFNATLNASTSYGRNWTHRFGTNVNYKKNNVNLYANYNTSSGKKNVLGLIKRPTNTQDFVGLDDYTNHMLKIGTDIDLNDKLSLSLFTVQRFNNLDYSNETDIFNPSNNVQTTDSRFEFNRKPKTQVYDASIHQQFDDKKHTLDLGVSYNITERPENSIWLNRLDLNNNALNYIEDIDEDKNRLIVNLDYAKPINDDIFIETGLELRKWNTDKSNFSTQEVLNSQNNIVSRDLSDFTFNRNLYSTYLNYRQQFNEKFGIQAGVRAEIYKLDANFIADVDDQNTDIKDDVFSLYPSFFANYKLTKKQQLQFSYSRRVDRPSVKQLTPIRTWGTPLIISIGNPNLQQQFTNSFEIKHLSKINIGTLTFAAFYRRVNDFISRNLSLDPTDDSNQRTILSYGNFDSTDNLGLEAAASLKPYRWWSLNTSADAYFQKQQGLVNGTSTTVDNIQFNFRINNTFIVGKNTTFQLSQFFRGPNKSIQWERKAMYGTNIAVNQKILKDKGSINLGFSDIFNTVRARFKSENPIPTDGNINWESQKVTLGFVYNIGVKNKAKRKKARPQADEKDAGGGGGL